MEQMDFISGRWINQGLDASIPSLPSVASPKPADGIKPSPMPESFPNELLLMVAGYLDTSTLGSLLRTNHHFAALLTPVLRQEFERAIEENLKEQDPDKVGLQWAAMRGNASLVRFLLEEKGLNPSIGWADGSGDALARAVVLGHNKVVRVILELFPDAFDREWNYISFAAECGWAGIIDVLLQKIEYNIDSPLDDDENTPLLLAAGSREVFSYMLSADIGNWWSEEIGERFSAPAASPDDYKAVINNLVAHGARVHNINASQQNALHRAAMRGMVDLAHFLAVEHRVHMDATDKDGFTPLHTAAYWGHEGFAEALLGLGATVSRDRKGHTPLHVAINRGKLPVAELLLRSGVSPNTENRFGDPMLHNAAHHGVQPMVRLLLDHGAEVNKTSTSTGGTALHVAVGQQHIRVVKLLVERGISVDVKNHDGKTARDIALEIGNNEIVQFLQGSR